MIALATTQQGPDWFGMAVVITITLGICLVGYLEHRYGHHHHRPWPQAPTAPLSDLAVHVKCAHPGCTHIICYCTTIPAALNGPCPGTVEPACWHDGTSVCFGHRHDCDRCELENASGWGSLA